MTIDAIVAIVSLVVCLPPTALVVWKCVRHRRRNICKVDGILFNPEAHSVQI